MFKVVDKELGYSNFTSEEWKALRSLAHDKQIVIKKADKGSCVMIWDRDDYLAEAERQLKDENVYRNVNFNEKLIENLNEYSKKIFEDIVPGQPVVSNCGTPTEKASEFLDSHLKPIM